jgi:hypothetical protein
MVGISFWVKYVLLVIFLAFCSVTWYCAMGLLALYICLDLWHEVLLEKQTRKAIVNKVCLRRIDKIIRDERRNLSRG